MLSFSSPSPAYAPPDCQTSNYGLWTVRNRALNFRRDTPDLIQIKNTPVQVGSIFFELTPRRIKARGIWTPVKTIIAQKRRTWHI